MAQFSLLLDVVVDNIQQISVELLADNKKEVFMLRGMAYGFVTSSDDVGIYYKVDNLYASKLESGIIYNNPDLKIDWGYR